MQSDEVHRGEAASYSTEYTCEGTEVHPGGEVNG